MFYTYILFSTSLNKYYIGSCQNIEQRLQDHLNSRSKFTKIAKDWELKYFETFLTRSEARKRELQIKKMKSRKYIETLIQTKG
ncbi:GIY-YIG nuclease family protein [Flavobacterium piscisymbiosum]|uniref:GIY-YIG nuclease family protein n=1 Tax=Flavobacterium piscisymbiosum TaxID=2893753 RepID=A0ABS8M942_9FLAO|nr:GIY-YIG nuclease family protein [Flavobacterium sp. F-30]MCC9062031.1 GIY-YIG nuclease family protein [Flavobacterium sp. F-30]